MRFRLGLVLALLSSAALAQSGVAVKQSGNVTPNTIPWWVTSGAIGGGVTSADSPISSFGVTNNGLQGFCVNSDRITAAGRNTLCLGVKTAGGPAQLTVQNYGNAAPLGFQFVINGSTITPAGGITNITVGNTTIGSGTNNCILYDLVGVLGCSTTLPSGTLGPTTTVLGNIAFWNSTNGTKLGSAPTFQSGNPGQAALYSPLASPAAGAGTFNAMQVGVGTPLTAADMPSPTSRLSQGIVGTFVIDAADTAISGYGVTGYAVSNSTSGANAIGLGGWGFCNGAGGASSCWAGADSVHNKVPSASVGLNANSVIGREIDVNIWKKTGAVEPTISHLQGLLITGGGDSTATQGTAFEADRLSVTTGAKWLNSFGSDAGAAATAFIAGPTARTGNNLPSQYITLQETDGTGAVRLSRILSSGLGSLIFQSPVTGGGVIQFGDTSGANYLTTGNVGGANVQINSMAAAGFVTNTATGVLNTSPFGTGVQTAIGINIGSAGAPVLFNGAGGTPSSLTLTNATGLPVTGGGTGSTVVPAVLNAAPANPTNTASTTLVMMGLGSTCTITTTTRTRVRFTITGQLNNTTAGDGIKYQLAYGTGTAPVNGAAISGTVFGTGPVTANAIAGGANPTYPFTATGIATGLSTATAYWFDTQLAATIGGTASITNLGCSAEEL